jgi:hypothetical protein
MEARLNADERKSSDPIECTNASDLVFLSPDDHKDSAGKKDSASFVREVRDRLCALTVESTYRCVAIRLRRVEPLKDYRYYSHSYVLRCTHFINTSPLSFLSHR